MCKFHEVGRNVVHGIERCEEISSSEVARLLEDSTLGGRGVVGLCLRSFLCKKNGVMIVCV